MIITHAFSSPVLGLLPRLSLNVLDFIPDPLTRLTVVPGSIQYILQASTSPLLFVCWGRLERKARRIRRGSGRVQFLNKRVDWALSSYKQIPDSILSYRGIQRQSPSHAGGEEQGPSWVGIFAESRRVASRKNRSSVGLHEQ